MTNGRPFTIDQKMLFVIAMDVQRTWLVMLTCFLAEDFSDTEELFTNDITKWSSNDLMDKIETIEVDEAQGKLCFCKKLIGVTLKRKCHSNKLNKKCMTELTFIVWVVRTNFNDVSTETLYREPGREYVVMRNEERQMEVHSLFFSCLFC